MNAILPEGTEIDRENKEQGEQGGAFTNVPVIQDSIRQEFLFGFQFRKSEMFES